jgi:MoaA/NifB/PqqE/SkfB family radical SAM enzyme
MGVIVIGLSGGEPLLRKDLPELIAHIDDRTIKEIFTTGIGLTVERAKALRDAGLDTIIISLDHLNPKKHDRMRRRTGAFHRAVDAIVLGVQMGFYTVVSTVCDRPFLFSSSIWQFLDFLGDLGVHEVRLLEPKPTGRLLFGEFGMYGEKEKERLRDIHVRANSSKTLPSIAAFAYVACGMNMGCVGGTTHMFIDNQGNVCTCDLLPLAYGSVFEEPLQDIVGRMREVHRNPRRTCLLPPLKQYIKDEFAGELPLPYEKTVKIMQHAPEEDMPGFFHKLNCLER